MDSHSGEKGGAKLSHKGLPRDGWMDSRSHCEEKGGA